ncbi:MAG: Flp pilus assembly protein CpaB [Acidimicrobiia bacterium]
MLRRSPRALLLWTAAAGVATATALLVGTDLATLHRRARDLGPEVAVAVATRDLPVGATIADGDLRVRRLHRSQLPADALQRDDAAGRVVAVPVLRDGYVSARNLVPRDRSGLDGVVPPGMRIVRIAADAPSAARRAGAAVDVLATFDAGVAIAPESGGPDDPTVVVAEGALVVAIDGETAAAGDLAGAEGADGMTLLVTEDEARALAYAAAAGVVTVALVPPEDARAALPT